MGLEWERCMCQRGGSFVFAWCPVDLFPLQDAGTAWGLWNTGGCRKGCWNSRCCGWDSPSSATPWTLQHCQGRQMALTSCASLINSHQSYWKTFLWGMDGYQEVQTLLGDINIEYRHLRVWMTLLLLIKWGIFQFFCMFFLAVLLLIILKLFPLSRIGMNNLKDFSSIKSSAKAISQYTRFVSASFRGRGKFLSLM